MTNHSEPWTLYNGPFLTMIMLFQALKKLIRSWHQLLLWLHHLITDLQIRHSDFFYLWQVIV